MAIRGQRGLFFGIRPIHLTLTLLVVLLFRSPVFGTYTVDWFTIDGGGGVCSGGKYVMVGTVGQPEPQINMGRVVFLSGGAFVFSGGYWPGSAGCVVNLTDLTIFVEQWLSIDPLSTADFDDSGRVDLEDFCELSYWWLEACPGGWPLK